MVASQPSLVNRPRISASEVVIDYSLESPWINQANRANNQLAILQNENILSQIKLPIEPFDKQVESSTKNSKRRKKSKPTLVQVSSFTKNEILQQHEQIQEWLQQIKEKGSLQSKQEMSSNLNNRGIKSNLSPKKKTFNAELIELGLTIALLY